MTQSNGTPEQRRMARLCYECLCYAEKNDGPFYLDIHPLDLKELWNINLHVVKSDSPYFCSFMEASLFIGPVGKEDFLNITLIPNTKRQRWLPRIRVLSGDNKCPQ